jgi:hypothetical protein
MTSVHDRVRKIEQGPALSRAGAKVIINPKGDLCGTIKIAYPKDGAGRMTVILHEHGFEPQISSAGGYGYDKLSAALCGLKFAGITLEDHPHNWEKQLHDAGYNVYSIL